METLKEKRAERAKQEQARRDELKRQHEEKKRQEQAAIQKEIDVCVTARTRAGRHSSLFSSQAINKQKAEEARLRV